MKIWGIIALRQISFVAEKLRVMSYELPAGKLTKEWIYRA